MRPHLLVFFFYLYIPACLNIYQPACILSFRMREIPDNKSTRYKTICDAKIGCINVSQFENSKSISSRMYHYLYLFSNAEYILENNQPIICHVKSRAFKESLCCLSDIGKHLFSY